MIPIPPSPRPPHPVLHAVASAAVALAIGLPFLHVLSRTAQFYGYADSGFGFWLATRALPLWAVAAIGLGVVTAFLSADRSLPFMLVRSAFAALVSAGILTAIFLAVTEPLREGSSERAGLMPVPLGHFLSHHLFEDPSKRKVDIDTCMLGDNGLYGRPGTKLSELYYEFCIPDSDALRHEVAAIDSTLQIESADRSSRCGAGRVLCRGQSGQGNPRQVLRQLSSLPYVRHIRAVGEKSAMEISGPGDQVGG